MTANQFDGIVIGGGHNGLICAAYMAKAGFKIAVMERAEKAGGGCSTEEVTLPGYRHNLHSNFYVGMNQAPFPKDLELHKYGLGLVFPPVQHGIAFSDGTAFTIHRDVEKTIDSIARISRKDAASFRDLHNKFGGEGMIDVVTSFIYSTPLPPEQMVERLSGPLGREFLSYTRLSMYEAVDQHFENEQIRTFFKVFLASSTLENTPTTGIFLPRFLSRMREYCLPVGGSINLSMALERVIKNYSGQLFTESEVKEILVKDGEARGVVLANGEHVHASKFVASGVNFPLTVQLAGTENFGPTLTKAAKEFRWARHSLCTLHLALKDKPRFKASRFDPEIEEAFNVFWGADTTEQISKCFEDIHAGKVPRLMGNGANNTQFDPTYAPVGGGHTAYWWPFVPYALNPGGPEAWNEKRKELTETFVQAWQAYVPNINQENILGAHLFTPYDIVRTQPNMVNGGHQIGAYLPEQLGYNRPHREVSNYRTPIHGLYLCGSTSHVGGAITGAPGYNCANALMEDLKGNRWWTPIRPAEGV